MNKVILIGRLTKDPDLRYTQSGQARVRFTLAVDKNLSRQKKQEFESQNRPTADFPSVIVRGVQAENAAKYLRKGSQCAVEGSLQTGSYQDKDGKTVYTTDINALHLEFIGSRSDNNASGYYQNNNYNQERPMDFNQDRQYTNNQQSNQNQNSNSGDDFFGDDFSELDDDSRIPF